MSYYPTTPMLHDVLVMQRLYGANWSYNFSIIICRPPHFDLRTIPS
jgi:hypothetical protein